MPVVDRSDDIVSSVSANWKAYGIVQKIQFVGVFFTAAVCTFIPEMILEGIKGRKKFNAGKLKTIVEHQIYQQPFGAGGSLSSTILMSKTKDALLIHTAPEMTPEFKEAIQALGAPVKYIMISNEVHETHASACKEAYPDAKVLCPKASTKQVEMCGFQVDASFEESMEKLEKEFGFLKTFRGDDNIHSSADRSFVLELYGDGVPKGKKVLFVGQCGYGHFPKLQLLAAMAGFQGWFTRGRYFRMFYWAFTTPEGQGRIHEYWNHMVNSVDDLYVAIFQHGSAIVGDDTKSKLLQFYTY